MQLEYVSKEQKAQYMLTFMETPKLGDMAPTLRPHQLQRPSAIT